MSDGITISGLMLRRSGGENDPLAKAIVLVEIDGKWVVVCEEYLASNFSHIVEPGLMRRRIQEASHE